MITRIHVNKSHIDKNLKDGLDRPVYTIKQDDITRYAREVLIKGPSKLVYTGNKLSCGARAWIETEADIETIGECSFGEARNG